MLSAVLKGFEDSFSRNTFLKACEIVVLAGGIRVSEKVMRIGTLEESFIVSLQERVSGVAPAKSDTLRLLTSG